jgi:hypothetical protein
MWKFVKIAANRWRGSTQADDLADLFDKLTAKKIPVTRI